MAKYNEIEYCFEVNDKVSTVNFKVNILPEEGDDIDLLRVDVRTLIKDEKDKAISQVLGNDPIA